MRITRVLQPLLLLALVSCAASPQAPATRYVLPPDAGGVQRANEGAPAGTLVLQNLRLAGYLDTAGIVLQLDDITLNEAGNHLWAEDLELLLQRGLRGRLANRLPEFRVLAGGDAGGGLQLRVEVDGFHGHFSGVAVASGQWQLRRGNGELLVQESFREETRLESDGYPALVRALGRSWDRAAERIAEGVQDAAAAAPRKVSE